MDQLRAYLNSLSPGDQAAFATRCGTSLGYLRKALSKGQALGEKLCINVERESDRAVLCEQLRGDVDWAYMRGSAGAVAVAVARDSEALSTSSFWGAPVGEGA